MYIKRLAIIAGPVALLVLALFFFQSSFSERRTRIQKEKALVESLSRLSEKETEILELKKQREEAEKILNEKAVSLESALSTLQGENDSLRASLKAQEEHVRALTDKQIALEKDRAALMEDNLERSQNVTILEKRITELESGRQELLGKIKDLENSKPSGEDRSANKGRSGVSGELRYEAPTPVIDPAKLGKVLVQKSTGRSAQVQHVNDVYQFVVLNAGSHDGLRKGSVINVIRADRIIAKAIVEKLKPDLSAALLVPESTLEPVQPGDFVTQF